MDPSAAEADTPIAVEHAARALSGTWNESREGRDALVARGADAVGPVLALLLDERAPVEWRLAQDVLQRIGEPALVPLVRVLEEAGSREAGRREAGTGEAGAQEIELRSGATLSGLRGADPGAYEPLLRHPRPRVRSAALSFFQGPAAADRVDRLVPLLGDPDPEVRRQALRTVEAARAAAVPRLRALRSGAAPGRWIRAGALEALAGIAGPAGLDGRDLAAWRRLTRIKQREEIPYGLHLCGSWYAVATADRDAVLAAFDLSDPEPVTLRTGEAAWNRDHHSWDRTSAHATCARRFVSPVLHSADGTAWTLVFGHTSQDDHRIEEDDDSERAHDVVVRERCTELSRRFGVAHAYGMSCGDGWTMWCIAEGGEVARHYDAYAVHEGEGAGVVGPAHPAEDGYLLPHEDGFPDDAFDGVELSDPEAFLARYTQVKKELGIPDTCYAADIAARLSVDPSALGPATRRSGPALLALTACGRGHGHPAGALPA
ncbi:HEAT repeat domain-containing protein [Streptomyces sp. N35]|uniref:HEAT repeat domain-containing protein n=1 Tax=Streptomyces sp. N35 TaxID=2795730 RepID=UPI0018F42763|nr:HEAT repeat domain-containing protein [Streptomyces sp. N35]